MAKQRRYFSFLLRLWQTSDGDQQVWRASLESPGTGEHRGFASLRQMFDFLLAQTGQSEPQDEEAQGLGPRE